MPPQTADGAAALHGERRGVSAATVVPGSPSSYTQYDRTCSHLRAPTFPLSSRVFGALSQRLPGADGSPSLVRQFVREELRQKNYHLADLRPCDSGGAPGQPVLGNTLLHVPAVDTNRGFSVGLQMFWLVSRLRRDALTATGQLMQRCDCFTDMVVSLFLFTPCQGYFIAHLFIMSGC